jgi:hypothetical protein
MWCWTLTLRSSDSDVLEYSAPPFKNQLVKFSVFLFFFQSRDASKVSATAVPNWCVDLPPPPPQLGLNSNSMALLRYTSDKVRWSDMGLAHVMYDSSNFCVLLVHGQIVRSGRIQEQC